MFILCFSGGLVSLYLRRWGGVTLLVVTSIQRPFRLKPSGECHSALPLSGPSVISLFDKNPETQTQEEVAVPLKTSSVLWQTLTQKCQITNSRSVVPYLTSAWPCLPPRPTGKYMCYTQITLCVPLNFSYYWWLCWLAWDLPFIIVVFWDQEGSVTELDHRSR